MFALKLARAAGLKVFLTSSSDQKLQDISRSYSDPPIVTINYSKTPAWHDEVLKLTDGVGVDLVIEVGGASSLLKSLRCTRRGGTISQVGYLSKEAFEDAAELLPTIIDRRVNLRSVFYALPSVVSRLTSTKGNKCRVEDGSRRPLRSAVRYPGPVRRYYRLGRAFRSCWRGNRKAMARSSGREIGARIVRRRGLCHLRSK